MQLHPAEQLALDAAKERDRQLRTQRDRARRHGIVHTPPQLARFVLRGVDQLLRERHGLAAGVSDSAVHLVDPACGPGAFLAATVQLRAANARPGAAFTGIDLDAEALALAAALAPHAHAGALALQWQCADTLRQPELLTALSQDRRVLAVVGNPPWTVSRTQASAAMQAQLDAFRHNADGTRLPEKKLGVLSDAYVRFVRWSAQAVLLAPAGGVVALVTNASFLDGIVHRGMRAALCRWFDALWVLDLGGNALLSRASASLRADENVFGVRPGVAISFLSRRAAGADGDADRHGQVHHTRLQGSKVEKLATLADATLADFRWSDPAAPDEPTRFVPCRARDAVYARWPSLAACMPFHREGVQTNRDAVVVDTDKLRLLARLRAFAQGASLPELRSANAALAHYDPASARVAVAQALAQDPDGTRNVSVRALAYRPHDLRWFCPVPPLCHRPRAQLLAAVDASMLSLVTVRKDRGSAPYEHFAVAVHAIDSSYLSTRSSCRSRAFPTHAPDGQPNLSHELRERLAELSAPAEAARDFVLYALCVLSAPSYRTRFDAELRQDYPRIPWPPSATLWRAMLATGAQLAAVLTQPTARASQRTVALGRADACFQQLLAAL